MSSETLILLPYPRQIAFLGGTLELRSGKLIAIANAGLFFTAQKLQNALQASGVQWQIVVESAVLPADQIGARLVLQAPQSDITSDKSRYQ